jgi:multicomponent Na+:H+ antiporter subunit G
VKILAVLMLFSGLLFFTGGSIGILRFPDFYSRLHPAGKLDTAGQFLTMSAIAIHVISQDLSVHTVLTALKILLIVIFVYLTSPTATHAIVDAGMRAGLYPWEKPKNHDLAD